MEALKPASWRRQIPEALILGGLFALVFRFPAACGHGYLEALMALLFPVLLFEATLRGRHAGWIYLALFAGLVGIFHWVPSTIASKGGFPLPLGLAFSALFWAYEALGFWLVALAARWVHRRSLPRLAPLGAACAAGLGMLLWEGLCFHVYPWSWGAPFGSLPWTARAAAFLGGRGLSVLAWAFGAAIGSLLGREDRPLKPTLALFAGFYALLALLSGAWFLLPRGPERKLDVVMIQPNFDPGLRDPGMEGEMWRRSDLALARYGLPLPGRATLLLWPESSVMGRNDSGPNPRLEAEAQRRGVAWLYGTEGGRPGDPYLRLNLVRGEAAGRPPFLQAKVVPMAFGERMPGPTSVREWLDARFDWHSEEPGELSPRSSFAVPTPQGELAVHPLICSEALLADRVQEGVREAGADLLTNHTNDGWFEQTIATDLHAAQIRLRAVEMGVPLLRATLTGKSGLFRADGTWELWDGARTEADYTFALRWRPVKTPQRSLWPQRLLMVALAAGIAAALVRRRA